MTNALRFNSGKAVAGNSRSELRVRKSGGRVARAMADAVNAALGTRRAGPMALVLAGGALMVAMNTMSAQAANGTWVQASPSGSQTLWGTGINWANGTIANGPGFVADFSTLNPTANTNPFINLDSPRSIGQLLFGESGANANVWNLANNGNATNILTLDNTGGSGGPLINVTSQTANISLVLAGTTGVTLTGGSGGTASSLILSGANTYSGTTTIHSNSTNLFTIDATTSAAFGNSTIFFDVGSTNFGRILLESGVNITNNITINTARAPAGANAAIMTNGNVAATWSGTITINGQATSGGDILGPFTASTTNFLTLSGPIIDNLPSQPKTTNGGNALILRAGNIRMSDTTGTSTVSKIENRDGILQVGANNGIATNAFVDLGGNLGNPGGPATVNLDLNGFNQTLVGISNYISNTQAEAITNSSSTTAATLTLAPADPTANPNQALLVFTAGGAGTGGNALISDTSASAPLNIVVNGAAAGVQYFTTPNGSYRGTTTLTSGTLAISALANGGSNSSIGASSNAATNLVFNGGTLQYVNFGLNVSNGNVALSNSFTPSTDRNFTINSGTSGTINVQASNATLTWSGGSAATTGSLIKAGPGTLILSGTNLHTGGTTVSAGVLELTGSLSTGTTSVSSGATFMGTGTIGGTLSVASAGILAPGNPTVNSGVGTLTTAGLTLNPGSIANFEFGSGNDVITVTGAGGLNIIGSNLDLYSAGTTNAFSTNGNYTLMNINGGFSGSLSNFTVANPVAGKFYALSSTASTVLLTIGDATTTEWNNSSTDGMWTTGGNWSNGTPNSVGVTAKFAFLTGGGTVNMNGDKTVSGLIFDNGNSYTISGSGNLTLNNGGAAASVTVNSGSHTVAVPIVAPKSTSVSFNNSSALNISGAISGGNPLSVSGTGTLTLTGNNSFSTSTLNGATLNVGTFGGSSTSGTLGTGTLTMTSNGTLNFNRSNAYVFAGGITGSGASAGSVNQLGTGTTTVSGAMSNLTSVNVSAGTLIAGSTLSQSGGIAVTGTGSLTANGTVSGVGGLTMSSTGTVNLNAANSYFVGNTTVAGTTINSGTVNLGAAGALPTNTALAVNGGVFNLGGNNIAISNILDTNPSTGVITNNGPTNSTSTITFTGSESDYNMYAAINDGASGGKVALVTSITNAQSANFRILHLNATSTFSGGITVNSQSIEADANNAFGTGPITITQNNSSTNWSQIYLAQNITINNNITVSQGHPVNNGAVIFQTIDAGNTTINGSVTILANNFSGGLFQGGASSFLIVNGAVYANGTADTIIQLGGNVQYAGTGGSYANMLINGTAQLGVTNGLATNAAIAFGLVPTGTASPGILDLNGFDQTAVSLSAPGTSAGGSVNNSGTGPNTLTLNTTGTTEFGGAINGNINLVVGGTGTQQLTSFSSYTGFTKLTGSAVVEATNLNYGGGSSSIGASSNAAANLVFDGGTLRYTGTDVSTDRGFTINAGKTAKIDVATAATNVTWIGSSPASTGGLTKLGPGTLTIDGSATHGYTGATTVSAGTLVVNDTLSSTSSVSIASGAVLAGSGTIGGTLTHTAGTINPGAVGSQSAGTITFSGLLTLNGGTVQYDVDGSQLGNNAAQDVVKANGGLTIAGPSIIDLEFLNPGSPPSSPFDFVLFTYSGSAVTQPQANNLSFITNIPARSSYTANVSIAGEVFVHVVPGVAANLKWNSNSSGLWDMTTANWLNGAVQDKFFNGDNVTFADGAGLQTNITMNQTLTPSSITVTSNTNNYTLSGNGTLAGAATLMMNGTSTLTIKTNNTYSGGTIINSGTVDVGGSSSNGSLGNGSVTNNGTLKFTRTDGNSVTPLTIANNISGTGNLFNSCAGTSIMNGTLTQANITLNGGGTTGLSGAVTVTGNLTVTGSTLAGSTGGISGSGGVVMSGTGTFAIQGSNSYDGNTVVNSGILFPDATAFGSTVGSTTVNSGGEIYATAQNTDYGNEAITLNGTGVTNGGALRAGGATTSTFDGPVTIGSNATINLDGGATLALTNANSLTGSNVTLSLAGGGTLQVSGNVSLGSGGAIATGTTPVAFAPPVSSNITVSSPLTGNGTITATTSGTPTITTMGTTILTADSPSYAGNVTIGNGAGNLQIQTSAGVGSTGTVNIAGSGSATALVATFQLNGVSGGITVANPLSIGARQGDGVDVPHVENIAGNNTLSGAITTVAGGTDYNFQSDAGTLTIQSGFTTTGLTTARNLKFSGAGSGAWNGAITEVAAAPVTVVMNGTGTWTLGGANTYSGGTNVNAGTLAVSGSLTGANVSIASGASFSVLAGGSISTASVLTNNGTVVFNNAQNTIASLNNSAGALVKLRGTAVKTSTFVEAGTADAWTSGMDIGVSKFILESTNKTADLAQFRNEVKFGKTNPGNGMFSTTLPGNFGIAVLDNAVLGRTTFGGIAVDANSVIVAAELLGDANVDGHVDLTDLSTVLNNFGTATPAWTSGNFDGAATIDLTDLSAVLNNFGLSNPNAFAGTFSGGASAAAATPEPASLAMIGLGAAMLLSRRRKSTI
ncbi:MAG TPA: autotransporter-associated beta strand repeat-containing protein [Phycisphaerae bacterium]|nr:autotransporter-associated beta strand repeat-containing protein [Phycisphaerae bacterium]